MIKPTTIQAVKDRMDIIDVIGQFLKLKKRGTNHIACCPFHAEKTESFTVSPAKQIYKCFGCGASGNAITYIIEQEKKTYPEAITWLAEYYHIPVETEDETPEKKAARETAQSQKDLYQNIVQLASDKYNKYLLAQPEDCLLRRYLTDRGITKEAMQFWNIGYAPGQWQFFTHDIIAKEWYQPAKQIGIIKETEGKVYDFFRERIIVPIQDHSGNVTGLGARLIPTGNVDEDKAAEKKYGKWTNSQDSIIYNKSKILFGLYQAIQAKAFKKPSIQNGEIFCYLVEGYFDVITLHEYGFPNTVATSGTALTEEHIKLLKRHTNHIVLLRDTDTAGHKAALRDIDHLLRADMRVEVIHLPTAKDIDEYARNYAPG